MTFKEIKEKYGVGSVLYTAYDYEIIVLNDGWAYKLIDSDVYEVGRIQDGSHLSGEDSIIDWIDVREERVLQKDICKCDFYTVVLTTGCRCGGL